MDDEMKGKEELNLEWKDWLALFIASLQTVFLPLLIFALILVVLYIVIILAGH